MLPLAVIRKISGSLPRSVCYQCNSTNSMKVAYMIAKFCRCKKKNKVSYGTININAVLHYEFKSSGKYNKKMKKKGGRAERASLSLEQTTI